MYERPYDCRNCSSLFGYAASVHARSGGICQLCGCGDEGEVNFDLWRQMTVEHLIGESQGGYPRQIRMAVAQRFPALSREQHDDLVRRIDEMNTCTACSFCNSTTSRDRAPWHLDALIAETDGDSDAVLAAVFDALQRVLQKKRADVCWRLTAVQAAFRERIEPAFSRVRAQHGPQR
jgi:hypothetical protein